MSYYDRIARQWDRATGRKGGAFKRFVLNDVLVEYIGDVDGRAILELGAGNGYFASHLLRQRSGQIPDRLVITDASSKLLRIAEKSGPREASYQQLDVRTRFPFSDGSFDIVLSVMLFNELSDGSVRRALSECKRILRESGRVIGAVVHPRFVDSLDRRGELQRVNSGTLTMPGSDGLRLPVVPRSVDRYERLFRISGFAPRMRDLMATDEVLKAKPGLKHVGNHPIALAFEALVADPTQESAESGRQFFFNIPAAS